MTGNTPNTGEQHQCQHRLRLRRTVAMGVVLVALVLAVGGGTAAAQTNINGCTQINSAGSYEITQDIEGTIQGKIGIICIEVAANDVAIDGNRNTINGSGGGVFVAPPSGQASVKNVTVENLTVTNSFGGIGVRSAEDVEVTDVVTSSTPLGGMSFDNTTDVNVEGVSVELTDLGVRVNGSENVTVRDSRVTSEELLFLPPDFDPGDLPGDPGDLPGDPGDLPGDPFTDPLDDSTLETQSHTGDETGIFFNNTLDGKIVDNTVTQFDGPGVEVLSSSPSFTSIPPDFPIDDLPIDEPIIDDPVIGFDEVSPAQVSPNTVVDNDLTDNTEGIVMEDSSLYDVDNNTVTNSTDDGILVSSSSLVSLTENEVSESGDNGIQLAEANENELRDNTVTENDDTGIYLNGTSTGNELRNNTANDNGRLTGPPPVGTYGIWLDENSSDNEIVGNEASENGIDGSGGIPNTPSAGIYLSGSSGGLSLASASGVSNNTVVDNTATGAQQTPTQRHGIWLSGADDNELRENTANENVESGIYLNGESAENEIEDNTANDNGHLSGGPGIGTYGIWLEGGSSDNEVVGNEAFDNGVGGSLGRSAGIYLGGARPIGPGLVENNTVEDNTAGSQPSGNQSYGIWLSGASENELVDNVAENNNEAGIYLGGARIGAIEVRNNTLVNNTARDSEYGIWLKSALDNDVSESLVEDNEEGIAVEEEPPVLSQDVETESVQGMGNTFTDDVSRNNDWDFVVDSDGGGGTSTYSTSSSGYPVTNLSIGESTAPGTTLSFNADDVRLTSVDNPEPNPDAENISRYFNASETPVASDAFLNVSLSYEDGDVAGVNESTLELLRFDTGPGEWLPTGSSVDEQNNLVSVNTTTFSDFGAFGEAQEGCPFDPVVCTYDPDGDIGTGELQQAINDFVQGNIGTGDLQAVINAFVQS